VKKNIIALILLLVLVIIVSPGIVGKLIEKSINENLIKAIDESSELIVTSQSFDRGWFSSEGQHRIALGDGQIRNALVVSQGTDAADQIPVLVINTHIDHGLIPLSSMSREKGSLAPGLGSAVSTMIVEFSDSETAEVPGTIYSALGLSGDLDSRYELQTGSKQVEDSEITWDTATIHVTSNASRNEIEFNGKVGVMSFGDKEQLVSIDSFVFEGRQTDTEYGFSVGDVELNIGPMNINSGDLKIGGNKGMNIMASLSLEDDKVTADMRIEMSGQTIPDFGDISLIADMNFNGLDAAALQAINTRLDELNKGQDPTVALMSSAEELKDLVAAGFDLAINQFDVALPMGTVETKMSLNVSKSDRDNFQWTSLLLGVEATLGLKIPEILIQMASSLNPQIGGFIGLGYLKKNGDNYEMDTEYKKGLLTVNGAPIPIPLEAFQ
jgi:uncharacterized protein YdgA (DUF945 family)